MVWLLVLSFHIRGTRTFPQDMGVTNYATVNKWLNGPV